MQSKLDAPDVFIPASLMVTITCDYNSEHHSWNEKMEEGMHMKDFIKKIEQRLATCAQKKPGGIAPIIENVQILLPFATVAE